MKHSMQAMAMERIAHIYCQSSLGGSPVAGVSFLFRENHVCWADGLKMFQPKGCEHNFLSPGYALMIFDAHRHTARFLPLTSLSRLSTLHHKQKSCYEARSFGVSMALHAINMVLQRKTTTPFELMSRLWIVLRSVWDPGGCVMISDYSTIWLLQSIILMYVISYIHTYIHTYIIHIYIYAYIHYITLHYITLHYITLHTYIF